MRAIYKLIISESQETRLDLVFKLIQEYGEAAVINILKNECDSLYRLKRNVDISLNLIFISTCILLTFLLFRGTSTLVLTMLVPIPPLLILGWNDYFKKNFQYEYENLWRILVNTNSKYFLSSLLNVYPAFDPIKPVLDYSFHLSRMLARVNDSDCNLLSSRNKMRLVYYLNYIYRRKKTEKLMLASNIILCFAKIGDKEQMVALKKLMDFTTQDKVQSAIQLQISEHMPSWEKRLGVLGSNARK